MGEPAQSAPPSMHVQGIAAAAGLRLQEGCGQQGGGTCARRAMGWGWMGRTARRSEPRLVHIARQVEGRGSNGAQRFLPPPSEKFFAHPPWGGWEVVAFVIYRESSTNVTFYSSSLRMLRSITNVTFNFRRSSAPLRMLRRLTNVTFLFFANVTF